MVFGVVMDKKIYSEEVSDEEIEKLQEEGHIIKVTKIDMDDPSFPRIKELLEKSESGGLGENEIEELMNIIEGRETKDKH